MVPNSKKYAKVCKETGQRPYERRVRKGEGQPGSAGRPVRDRMKDGWGEPGSIGRPARDRMKGGWVEREWRGGGDACEIVQVDTCR